MCSMYSYVTKVTGILKRKFGLLFLLFQESEISEKKNVQKNEGKKNNKIHLPL